MRIFIALMISALPSIVAAGIHDWPSIHQWPEVVKTPVAETLPDEVLVLSRDDCPACVTMDNATKKWGIGIRFKKVLELPIATDGYPAVCFKGEDGKWWGYTGWWGRDHFLQQYYRARPKAKEAKMKKMAQSYPVRGNNWTGPDGKHDFGNREEAIEHLMGDGMHRGRFSRSILELMTLQQLRSLHSDDHEGRQYWGVRRFD